MTMGRITPHFNAVNKIYNNIGMVNNIGMEI